MSRSIPKRIGKALVVVCALAVIVGTAAAAVQAPLLIDGSTTVYPIVQVGETRFPVQFPDTTLSVTSTGSGHGQKAIMNNLVDIAMSSSNCSSSNACQIDANYNCIPGTTSPYVCNQLIDTVIARDALSIIVNQNRACANAISKLQLRAIYMGGVLSGTTTISRTVPPTRYTWQQIFPNCAGQPFAGNYIVPRARIIGSGTRQSFFELIQLSSSGPNNAAAIDTAEQATIAATGLDRGPGNPEIEAYIGANADQIGYVGLAFFDPNIRAVAVDPGNNFPANVSAAVAPSEATVVNGTYPLARNLHLFTLPTSVRPNQRIQDFIQWAAGPEAQGIVQNIGFVRVGAQAPDWDVNLDRSATILDIAQIGISFGETAPASGNPADPLVRGWKRADVNWDGTVNILDVAQVGNFYGQSW